MNAQAYWDQIYRTKQSDQVSWFQPEATLSLRLIRAVAPPTDTAILDVGGGASTLVDGLRALGYQQLTVLDISAAALAVAQQRLGAAAEHVRWRDVDLLTADLPVQGYDLWHDRAVFHFLTSATDRARYVEQVRRALRPAGHVLIATFAEDGPTRCSGLDVQRYSQETLHGELGSDFRLVAGQRDEHVTPSGSRQAFTYCLFRYDPRATAGLTAETGVIPRTGEGRTFERTPR